MEYTKRAIKGTVIVLIMYLLAGFVGYLFRLFIARNLTPTEYGLFYAVFSFVMFFSIFTDFGISSAVIRFIPEFQVKKRLDLIKNSVVFTFTFQCIISAVIAFVLYIISNWLAVNYFHNAEAAPVLKIFAIIFWLSCFNLFTASFQGFQKMFAYSSMNFLKMLSILIITILLSYLGLKVMSPTYAYLLGYLIVVVVSLIIFFKIFLDFFKYKTKIDKPLIKKLFKFGIPVTLSSLSYLIIGYTDTLMLTYFKTLNDVAFYNIAMPISMILMWFLAHPLSAVLLPMTSEMWNKKNIKSLKNGIETLQKYVFLAMVPLALIMMSFPDVVIRVLFGEAYVGASTALQILAFGTIFYSIAYINSNILSGMGKPELITKIMASIAVLNLILNFLLIPPLGIIGAAIATSVSYITMLFLTSIMLRKHINLKIPFAYFIKSILIGLVAIGIIYYLKKLLVLNYLVEMVIILIIASTIYVLLANLLKLFKFKEVFNLAKHIIK